MEFMNVFKEWADVYDDTVFNQGEDNEYQDVFAGYESMLNNAVSNASGRILEIGAGTGNLTQRLKAAHDSVIAIDPSEEMRTIANHKLGETVYDGHFLSIPSEGPFDTIISTFAFHHLTDEMKQQAFEYMKLFLSNEGKIVMIDTVFDSPTTKQQFVEKYTALGHLNLVEDLNTEYYTYVEEINRMVESLNGKVQWDKQNDFAKLMVIQFNE